MGNFLKTGNERKGEKSIQESIKWFYEQEDMRDNPTAYFFDLRAIRANIKRLAQDMPKQVQAYYAMKANPNRDVMRCIGEMDFIKGVEIASAGELGLALNYYKSDNIIFTGPGKTEYELRNAIDNRIKYINIESIVEAVRVNNIAKALKREYVDVLLRINLNYAGIKEAERMAGYSTKMGIDEDEFVESFQKIRGLERIRVKGIHAFAASGILDYQALLDADKYIFELVMQLQRIFEDMPVIDFGGGLGIDYSNERREFDIERYKEGLAELIEKYRFHEKEIIMELGTYITGNAGYYTAKIIDIKKVKGKKHIIIAGGVNHMGLPLEMRRKHPVEIISMNVPKLYAGQPGVYSEIADISGPLCIVSDKLYWDEKIEKAEIGDIVIFYQAGAYCFEEGMHKFLMHELPAVKIFDVPEEEYSV